MFIINKMLLKLAWNMPLEMEEYLILLQKCVLESLSIELYTQLISIHSGSSQKNRMSDEVRGWGSPCWVRMNHKLSGRYMHILIKTPFNADLSEIESTSETFREIICSRTLTFNKLKNSWESTCGIWGRMPCRILCHFSPLVGRGSAPEALITVRARANMSAFFRLL